MWCRSGHLSPIQVPSRWCFLIHAAEQFPGIQWASQTQICLHEPLKVRPHLCDARSRILSKISLICTKEDRGKKEQGCTQNQAECPEVDRTSEAICKVCISRKHNNNSQLRGAPVYKGLRTQENTIWFSQHPWIPENSLLVLAYTQYMVRILHIKSSFGSRHVLRYRT